MLDCDLAHLIDL